MLAYLLHAPARLRQNDKFKTEKKIRATDFHWLSGRKQPVALGVKAHDVPNVSQWLDAVPQRYGISSLMSAVLMQYMDGCFGGISIYTL